MGGTQTHLVEHEYYHWDEKGVIVLVGRPALHVHHHRDSLALLGRSARAQERLSTVERDGTVIW